MTPEALVLRSSSVITAGEVFKTVFSLVLVVGLIYLIARFLMPRLKVAGSGRLIQVVDRMMIEPQVAAYILKVGKKSWLIVSGGKNVQKIADLGEEPLN